MPIRVRILLLTLLSIAAVTTAFLFKYEDYRETTRLAESHQMVIRQALALSNLIHELQKERGLTAGVLVDKAPARVAVLKKQRAASDEQLQQLRGVSFGSEEAASIIAELAFSLPGFRRQVDQGKATWKGVRPYYSSRIQKSIDAITRMDRLLPMGRATLELHTLSNLAVSRESLGLIRATINRIYSRGYPDAFEVMSVAKLYGAYLENLRLFRRDAGEELVAWLDELMVDVKSPLVIRRVENVLRPTEKVIPSPELWWRDATAVVDQLKVVEDHAFRQLQARISSMVEKRRSDLAFFGLVAGSITFGVVALAALTFARMLKALSILLGTLDLIMYTQDFKLRVKGEELRRDEFGRIGRTINGLLTFTDRIIDDKDFLANCDPLTDLANRRRLEELVVREFKRDDRYGQGVGLIFCDIDFFKRINDTHGHDIGDDVLKAFSEMLVAQTRDNDTVARWGGEEFVILLPEQNLEGAEVLAEKLRKETETLHLPEVGQISCSFGVAIRQKGELLEPLCKRADEAVYRAKKEGRNRVCVAHDTLGSVV
ncbi:MAG: diguanylate cyclase [Magnetococcales bacterium]|nr:diguanylate cyclase [Magnetococcales bacterium]